MISDSIVFVRLCKHTKGDSEYNYFIVDYSTPEEAEKVMEMAVSFMGIDLEKDFARKMSLKNGKKPAPNFKSKVYLGNLPESFTDDDLRGALTEDIAPKNMFVSRTTNGQKKYAFLEFASEAERNMALGLLERIKEGGVFGENAIVSPAYPYSQARNQSSRR